MYMYTYIYIYIYIYKIFKFRLHPLILISLITEMYYIVIYSNIKFIKIYTYKYKIQYYEILLYHFVILKINFAMH